MVKLVFVFVCLSVVLSVSSAGRVLDAIHSVFHKNNDNGNFKKLKITLPNPLEPSTKKYWFNDVPLNQSQAISQNWTSLSGSDCTNGGRYNGYRYVPQDAPSVAAIYDSNGVVSGFQMILNKKQIMRNNTYHFSTQPMIQVETINGVESFVLTAYFSDPQTICSSTKRGDNLERDGFGSELYLQNGPTPNVLIVVPKTRSEANAEGWNSNRCLVLNGYHNFFQSNKWQDSDCNDIMPAWAFYDRHGNLSGFGFTCAGTDDSARFQHPPGTVVQFVLNEDGNTCAKRIADTIGFSNINVYFTDPYSTELTCPHIIA